MIRDPALRAIEAKVEAGRRLTASDAEVLYRTTDLVGLGALAHAVRTRLHADAVYFNVNRHINPTNVCVYRCGFCAFARRRETDDGAWAYAINEVLARAEGAESAGVTEFHIVGGLHPKWPFETYVEILRALKAAHPTVHLKAYTAIEIDWFTILTRKPVEWVLERLIEAGLGSLPGGGAESFAEETRARICGQKADARRWIEIHRAAHRLGLRSNATMLYGHVESVADRIDHLMRLRALQDETGGLQVYIPLAFHPAGAPTMSHLPAPTGVDHLREIAVGRLLLDTIAHIKTYWTTVGAGLSQVALDWGADDIDGTVLDERIYHMAGATTPTGLARDDLVRLIRRAGKTPVERDSLYRVIRHEAAAA